MTAEQDTEDTEYSGGQVAPRIPQRIVDQFGDIDAALDAIDVNGSGHLVSKISTEPPLVEKNIHIRRRGGGGRPRPARNKRLR